MADDKDGRESSGKNKQAWRDAKNRERAHEHEEDSEAGAGADPRPEADDEKPDDTAAK